MNDAEIQAEDQREELAERLAKHHLASLLPTRIRDMALNSSFEVFGDFEMEFRGGFSHLVIRAKEDAIHSIHIG